MSAAENNDLIVRFYTAFAAHDGAAMASCYTHDARFSDPVFSGLTGVEPGMMWRMLTGRAEDLEVELVEHDCSDDSGNARWIAEYSFAQTGRHVVNDVRSHFRFRDGLICEQLDEFDFYRWSRQALGMPGLLLGWTPFLRSSVGRRARVGLDDFIADTAA